MLRALADLVGRHSWMRREHLGPYCGRNEPVSRERCAVDARSLAFLNLLPTLEIHSSWKRRQHDELCECDAGPLRELRSRIERLWSIRRQAEDERTENMHAVFPENLKALNHTLA